VSDPVQVTYERWWVVSESLNSYGGNPQKKVEHASAKAAVLDVGKRLNRESVRADRLPQWRLLRSCRMVGAFLVGGRPYNTLKPDVRLEEQEREPEDSGREQ
jgi:hypothetical protein